MERRDLRFEKVERAFRVSGLPGTQDPGPSFPIVSRTCFRPVSQFRVVSGVRWVVSVERSSGPINSPGLEGT